MEIITNYKKNFTQYFPILFFNDNGNSVFMFGLGDKNISFVFGKSNNSKYKNGGQIDEKEFTFIWYKRMVSGDTTHYTQPFRTTIKAKNRDEAKEKLSKFVLGKMNLVICDEDSFKKSVFSSINRDFELVNRKMKDMDDLLKKYRDRFERY